MHPWQSHGQPPQQPQQPYGRPPQGPPYPPPQGHPYAPPRPGPPPRSNTGVIVALVAGLSLVLVAGAIAVVVAVGGSTDAGGASPYDIDITLPGTAAPPTAETRPSRAASPEAAKVGQTVTVQGLQPGVRVAATLTRVVDEATPANQFLKPSEGSRYVAVELTLENVGQEVYSDSPMFGSTLIDSEGRQYQATFAEVKEGVSFGGAVTVSKGDSRKGVIVFEVPTSAAPAKFQFGTILGEQKAEWTLK
ncbi:DUF4352 domain-containing protein [Planobispora siamensis]|nr:DUF4352 domain-containing protein [Planobispora siamensis]